jgi:putative Ca2+/H+ antiporter (TMEM165/GDT1 family)
MSSLDLAIVAAVYPVIFIAELPDKSMFASLVMASRGRPFMVWLGTAVAFTVHIVIAVSIGVGLFRVLPEEAIDVVVAILFGVSAVTAFIAAFEAEQHQQEIIREHRAHRVFGTAFLVIFLAEWGDLTQVLTANLAVRYGSGISVAIGAALALWSVSALAVLGGHGLLARLPARGLRLATGSVLAVLSIVSLVAAFR